jgi:GNAT superfamily N-acetyltransferase
LRRLLDCLTLLGASYTSTHDHYAEYNVYVFEIRRLRPEDWRAYREIRLRALQDSPHAFGSTFEVERSKSDEYWEGRLISAAMSSQQLPLGAYEGAHLVGLVWGAIDSQRSETIHVIQMWVDPDARGRGIGSQLLTSVIQWAREKDARSVHLRVTCGDTPATRLYFRAGFRSTSDVEPLRPGATELTRLMTLDLATHAA